MNIKEKDIIEKYYRNNKEKDIIEKCYNSWIEHKNFMKNENITPFRKYCAYSISLIEKQRKKTNKKEK